MPRVSVIVPAYNAARFLARALDSVQAQTFGDWEVVVADDGSTDATAAIAAAHPVGARVVAHPANQGLAAARNLALEAASGELVALLDADDAWLPDYLAQMVARYDAERARGMRVGIVCCDALLVRPDGSTDGRYGDRFGAFREPLDAGTLLDGNPIFVGVLLPRDVVLAHRGFRRELRSAEDLDLWLRLVEDGYRVAHVDRPLVRYHLRDDSLSSDTIGMTRARQTVYRDALRRGRLGPAQRRAARRAIRLQAAAEIVERARRRSGRDAPRAVAALLVASPLLCRVAVDRLRSGPRPSSPNAILPRRARHRH